MKAVRDWHGCFEGEKHDKSLKDETVVASKDGVELADCTDP